MRVTKRDGSLEPVQLDKITQRLALCAKRANLTSIDVTELAIDVTRGLHDRVRTSQLDVLASEEAAARASTHHEWATLAATLVVSNHHKLTGDDRHAFSTTTAQLARAGVVAPRYAAAVAKHADTLDKLADYERDYLYNYFGIQTLLRGKYLLRINGTPVERPQDAHLRVAVQLSLDALAAEAAPTAAAAALSDVAERYDAYSNLRLTHGSPTLFNSGLIAPQLASCFLFSVTDDTIDGIYETLQRTALVSKHGGGVGVAISNIRAKGARIYSTDGQSSGIVPMLKVYGATARYVDQGGGKRKGSFAFYLEPWHADIFDFLLLPRPSRSASSEAAADLFYALWVPDEFMRRVDANQSWSLFSPDDAPNLVDTHSGEFDALYAQLEDDARAWEQLPPTHQQTLRALWTHKDTRHIHYPPGAPRPLVRRVVPARTLWAHILDSQIESGRPYILFKDACNAKSNQQHLGTIRCSNLCTEIVQYTSPDQVAVCNLASIALPRFVATDAKATAAAFPAAAVAAEAAAVAFDFDALAAVTRTAVRALDAIIDETHYPIPEARHSNTLHRPIGIGVQGLADVFHTLGLPYESPAAALLNDDIFRTIYDAAIRASAELAAERGAHPSFPNSPASRGLLQPDLWRERKEAPAEVGAASAEASAEAPVPASAPAAPVTDWDALRALARRGLRNSLLTTCMPTASTAQILGNTESFEPLTANIYVRRVLSGEYQVVNLSLQRALLARNLWTEDVRQSILANNGSVQQLRPLIGNHLADLYKTVWEIKQRHAADLAARRGRYICQSQSLNVYIQDPTHAKLTSYLFHAWRRGLKTGMYYLRTRPAVDPIKFTVVAPTAVPPAAVCPRRRPPRGTGPEDPNEVPGPCDACSA